MKLVNSYPFLKQLEAREREEEMFVRGHIEGEGEERERGVNKRPCRTPWQFGRFCGNRPNLIGKIERCKNYFQTLE